MKRLGIMLFVSLGIVATSQAVEVFVSTPKKKELTGQMIVRPITMKAWLQKGLTSTQATARLAEAQTEVQGDVLRTVTQTGEYIVRVPLHMNETTYASELMATGLFQYVRPNWRVYPVGSYTPNDPMLSSQWHHAMIQSKLAWDLVRPTDTVTVAICDTGVKTDHVDLKASIVKGYNAVIKKKEVDGGDVQDLNGHGTHVAGCAAAVGDNAIGVAGVGYKLKIMPIRVSDSPSGGAFLSDLQDAARFAADHGAKAANVSYTGADDESNQTTAEYVKSKGALFLYAAGNDARDLSNYFHKDLIVVGSTDQTDQRSSFSAYGRGTHVFAPGSSILSTTRDGGYQFFSGTSMATPVTTGLVGYMFSVNPALTADQIQGFLESTCDIIGPESIYSHGRINAFRAIEAVLPYKDYDGSDFLPLFGTVALNPANALVNADGSNVVMNSKLDPIWGQAVGAEMNVQVDPDPNKLSRFGIRFIAKSNLTDNHTATVMLYNHVGKRYEALKTMRLSPGSNAIEIQPKASDVVSKRYIDATGKVKVAFRVHNPRTGTYNPPAFRVWVDMFRVREWFKV